MKKDNAIEIAKLPEPSRRSTAELLGTKPLKKVRGLRVSRLELYAFYVVATLVFISGIVVSQHFLNEYELTILVFVMLPVLAWGIWIYYRA